jgi:putative endonuclease
MSASHWFLYIVKTCNNALYTGITTDIKRRFAEHVSQSPKSAKALRGKGPLKLVYCCEIGEHSTALRAEIWVKKQSKSNKLKLVAQASELPFEHKILSAHKYTAKQ